MSDYGRNIGRMMNGFAAVAAFGIVFVLFGALAFILLLCSAPTAALYSLACGFGLGTVVAVLAYRSE